MNPILEFQSVSKQFSGVQALRSVGFQIAAGEVHALVGENGAGKSTLIKLATGVIAASQGTILYQGKRTAWPSPVHARRAGIAAIHQEADLFLDLTAAENILFFSTFPKKRLGLIDWKTAYAHCSQCFGQVRESISPQCPARLLTAAQRQMTEIVSAISQNAKVIFMDEPTSSLSMRETEILFSLIAELKHQGVTIVYISHRLEEIFRIADRITVLRDGKRIWTRPASEVSRKKLVSAIAGREIVYTARPPGQPGPSVLETDRLSSSDGKIKNVSFHLRQGEITGLYGLVGAGRSELAQTLFGIRPITGGRIRLFGESFTPRSPKHCLKEGLVYVPEDRLLQGLFQQQSIRTNLTVGSLKNCSAHGFISRKAESVLALQRSEKYAVKSPTLERPVVTLSGGNQQKTVLGRWIETEPRILILDEPTKGVDVGAKAEIHRMIHQQADRGVAVLMIASELSEILASCSRILVMREGTISGSFNADDASQEAILTAALPDESTQIETNEKSESKTLLASAGKAARRIYRDHREIGVLSILLFFWMGLFIFAPGFRSWESLAGIFTNASGVMIAAIGMTLVIAAGGIDISVGSLMALSAVSGGMLLEAGCSVWLSITVGLATGLLGGAVNATATYYGRIHSILTTLGTMSVFRALVIQITGGRWVNDLPDSFTAIGRTRFPGDGWFSFPVPVWIALGSVLVFDVFLRRTVTGRSVLALGSNPKASRLAGLSEKRIRYLTFCAGGTLTALAGLLHTARFGQVQTNLGFGFELDVIAAAVLGGCSIMGGSGSAVGAALGALLLATVRTMLVYLHISTFYEKIAIGLLILAAVLADHAFESRRRRE